MPERKYRYGKTAAKHLFKFKFRDYVTISRLPAPRKNFGQEGRITSWGMNGNDQYGCCGPAGAGHETRLWNAIAGREIAIGTAATLADYSAITAMSGQPFNPDNPDTDTGIDMHQMAIYRRTVGMLDDAGRRHKIAGSLEVTPGDIDELRHAAFIFKVAGVGFLMPSKTQDQFEAGEPWSVIPGDPIEGGHYTPTVAWRDWMPWVVTWGGMQAVEQDFYRKQNDETVVYVSEEFLTDGVSPQGFDLQHLLDDMKTMA